MADGPSVVITELCLQTTQRENLQKMIQHNKKHFSLWLIEHRAAKASVTAA